MAHRLRIEPGTFGTGINHSTLRQSAPLGKMGAFRKSGCFRPDRTEKRRCSPVESEVDLDLEYIENVLTDYDSQHLQKQEST